MRYVLTGGCGFLGRKLVRALLSGPDGDRVDGITLLDQAAPPPEWDESDDRVDVVVGDLGDPDTLEAVITPGIDVVYHLAAVVSAGAERDFELGYRVNLDGTRAVLDRCRGLATAPTVVFTSSIACYGSSVGDVIDDATTVRPESSYGVQKVAGELLVNDYHRKGFIDGRTARLPTVAVRPGKPNLAASSYASSIIREPLQGVDVVCPVGPEALIAIISPSAAVDALVRIARLDTDALGGDRALLLPGVAVSAAEAVAEAERQGGRRGLRLGTVTYEPDPAIEAIVSSWPTEVRADRAVALGFRSDRSVVDVVTHFLDDDLIR